MTEHKLTAGVDEAGRGPLAGPVIAAAVILNPEKPIEGLADSKLLTPAKREYLADLLKTYALAWSIGRAETDEIDQLNILQASLLAMQRAVNQLQPQPVLALIDGNRCPLLACETQAIVKGDSKIAAISAASILAKVTRDAEMLVYHQQYPDYGFAVHKGYPTAQHLKKLRELGPSPIHRRTFGPVKDCLKSLPYWPYTLRA